MWQRFALIVLLASLTIISGCATTRKLPFSVYVDSISAEGAGAKKSYILLPGNKDASAEELQFKEYAAYVQRALVEKGFVPEDRFEKADIAIFLTYGIGDPKEHLYSYSLPVWGQTGVSSSQTFGSVNTYGNSGTYSGTTTYTPTFGITGYTSHVGSTTTYFRFILLDAYDLDSYRKQNKMSQSWKTTITSTGTTGDLRRIFPIMVAGSKMYLGTNTGQKIQVYIYDDDMAVLEIKGVKPEPAKQKQ